MSTKLAVRVEEPSEKSTSITLNLTVLLLSLKSYRLGWLYRVAWYNTLVILSKKMHLKLQLKDSAVLVT